MAVVVVAVIFFVVVLVFVPVLVVAKDVVLVDVLVDVVVALDALVLIVAVTVLVVVTVTEVVRVDVDVVAVIVVVGYGGQIANVFAEHTPYAGLDTIHPMYGLCVAALGPAYNEKRRPKRLNIQSITCQTTRKPIMITCGMFWGTTNEPWFRQIKMYKLTVLSNGNDTIDNCALESISKYAAMLVNEGNTIVASGVFVLKVTELATDASAGNCTCNSALLYEKEM